MQRTNDTLIQQALELQSIVQYKESNPIAFFEPQTYQEELFDESLLEGKRIVGILGGNKSGKTYAVAAYLIKRLLEKKRFAIVSTWSNLSKELSRIIYELLPKNDLVSYAVYNPAHGFIRRTILFSNGSEIRLCTTEQGREAYQSFSCDYIWFDEETEKDIWDEALFRIAHMDDAKILISATPVRGFTFLQQVFEVQAKTDPSVISFKWDSLSNKYINRDNVKSVLDNLTEDEMRMRRFGEFKNQKSGLVLSKFVWDNVVVSKNPFLPTEYNPSSPIIACVDFNFAILPIVLLQKYGERYYCFDTVSMKNGNTETCAIMCKQKYPSATFRVYCDAAGTANKTSASQTDVNLLEKVFGVRVKYQHVKNIKDRIEALNAYFMNAKKETRLFIHQSNKELLIDCQTVDWTLYEGRRKQGERTHHIDALSAYFFYEHDLSRGIKGRML